MKRKTVSIAIGVFLAMSAALAVVLTSVWANSSDDAYLALGDSVAKGVGATDPETGAYVPQFHQFLQGEESDMALINLAVNGETSGSFISDGQLAAAVAAIDDSDVEVVTLNIGGNDLLGLLKPGEPCNPNPNSPACQLAVGNVLTAFAGNYTAIMGALTEALGGDEGVMVMTYYNAFSGTGSPFDAPIEAALLGGDMTIDCTAMGDPSKTGLNDLIACIGGSFGATVVNVHPLFDGQAVVLTHIALGDIHPNDAGHTVVADAFANAFGNDDDDSDGSSDGDSDSDSSEDSDSD